MLWSLVPEVTLSLATLATIVAVPGDYSRLPATIVASVDEALVCRRYYVGTIRIKTREINQ